MLDFHDHAAGIDYPFVSGTSLRIGSYALPTGLFLDAGITLYGGHAEVALSSIRRAQNGFSIAFDTPGEKLVFSGAGFGAFGASNKAASGFILLGADFPAFLSRLAPDNDYPARNVVLEPGRVQALDGYCVTSVNLYNGAVLSARGITGDLTFIAGRNSRIGIVEEDNALVLLAARGAGTGLPCYPDDPEDDPCSGFIRSINGAVADDTGDIRLVGGPKVDVTEYPEEHKVVIDFTRATVQGGCEV